MKTLTKLGNVFDSANNYLMVLSCILIAAISLLITVEVTIRKFFNSSIPGVTEIAEYALLYITFLATAWLLKEEGHVKMEFMLAKLSSRAQVIINILTSLLGALICVVLAWYSAETTWDHFQRGVFNPTTLEVPVAPLIAIIPIGSFLLFIQFLRRANGYLSKWKRLRVEGKEEEKPAEFAF